MPGPIRVSRRFVTGAAGLAGIAGLAAVTAAGCDTTSPPRSSRSPGPGAPPRSATTDPVAAADARLRDRALADERRLLAGAAAPAGVEPFATIRNLHRQHVRVLTGRLPPEPAPRAAPGVAAFAAAERTAAAARRADCVAASAALAPLLASLSASADVAVSLLGPQPS